LAAAATRGFIMVLFTEPVSRRNTFVGGTCATPSALLVYWYSEWRGYAQYKDMHVRRRRQRFSYLRRGDLHLVLFQPV